MEGFSIYSTILKCLLAIALICACPQAAGQSQKLGPIHRVNINTATRTELMQIPKLGEKMADRIVEFRKANGPFSRTEELMNVQGIGEKTYLSIKPHLTVGDKKAIRQSPQDGKRPQ
jgi:competence protein ComEA